jgi:hypothetical protein
MRKIKLLLTLTAFGISSAVASEFSISDGYNGFPEEVIRNQELLSKAQKQVLDKFGQILMECETSLEQIKRYFSDAVLDGDQNAVKIVKALRDFYTKKINDIGFAKIFFESHKGVNIPKFESNSMKDLPPSLGAYNKLKKELQQFESSIKQLSEKKKNLPNDILVIENQESQFKQEIDSLQKKDIPSCQKEIEKLQEQKKSMESQLEKLVDENILQSKKIEELTPKKNESSNSEVVQENSVQAENSELTKLKEQRTLNSKQQEEFVSKIQTLNTQVQTEEKKILSLKQKIQELENSLQEKGKQKILLKEEGSKLEEDLKELQKQKKNVQDQADLHALVKFISYRNIYDALPNEEKKLLDNDLELCTVVDSLQEGILTKSVYQTVLNISFDNVKKTAERVEKGIIQKFDKKWEQELGQIAFNIIYNFAKEVHGSYWENSSTNSDLEKVQERKIKQQNVFSCISQKTLPLIKYEGHDRHQLYFKTQESSEDYLIKGNRVDLLVKKQVDKWKNRISKDGLIHFYGLTSSLFNPVFEEKTQGQLFSFNDLVKTMGQETLANYTQKLESLESKKLAYEWGLTQLQINFSDEMMKKNAIIISKVEPIHQFVTAKLKDLSQEQRKGRYGQLLQENKDAAASYALLKYVSYLSMRYALMHSEKGLKQSTLQMLPLGFETLIKEKPEDHYRLDNVFAAQAYKWGQVLKEKHGDFLSTHAFTANYF